MIKATVLYPNAPGARFDHDYYRDRHMPLVAERMGPHCLGYTIDRGIPSPGGEAPPFLAVCHILAEDLERFRAGFEPHAEELFGDIPHYTDVTPVVQFSEVVRG